MKPFLLIGINLLIVNLLPLNAAEKPLPREMEKVMNQEKYAHAIWGIYAKDTQTGEVLIDHHSNKFFSPASTTKLFSTAALLHTFGDDYRFKTPVYTTGKLEEGKLQGSLVLVAQGDLTFGGRQSSPKTISYTKLDHTIANQVPGAILTKEDPLHGLNELARQVRQTGIKEVQGDVIIDDRLFETTEKRGMILTPILINENLIDLVINPTFNGQKANVGWRPHVEGYEVENLVRTVGRDGPLEIAVTSDGAGKKIRVQGTIPTGQKDVIRTFSIKDPKAFARAAFIQALKQKGVKINAPKEPSVKLETLPPFNPDLAVGLWTSPPLSEYIKLILKVSHNLGADLIPLLLASHDGKKTFDEGMKLFGDFVSNEVKLPQNSFVFLDGAGGNENRLTPKGEIQLLEYIYNLPNDEFQHYYDALPILGVDGSLEDFGKKTDAAGMVRAKTGTGASFNAATGKFFLITQAYSGYIFGKNDHLYAYMVVVNNAAMPEMKDVFGIFEDEATLSNLIFNQTNGK